MSEKKTAIVTGESQNERYAVIEVRRSEVFPERFVIAYRDEESLRELIAAPSIIGIGFSSREAAVTVVPNSSSGDADSKNTWERPAFRSEGDCRVPQSPRQRLQHSVGLKGTRRIACAALQHAIAAGVLMFYSKNFIGAALRAFVCG